jgi:DNA-binding transcriptional ArsR family regulator
MTTASNGARARNDWYLVSSQGSVLLFIAVNPGCTIREIAEEMALTQRTIWGLIGDLRRAHMLNVRREGRRHHYTVNLDAEFKHPIFGGPTLRLILGELIRQHASPERERSRQREAPPA